MTCPIYPYGGAVLFAAFLGIFNVSRFFSLKRLNSTLASSPASLSKYFDHTALKADTTTESIKKLCEEAIEHNFASVCVNSCHVPYVASLLKGSDVKVCAVVGFPLGAMSSAAKAFEAQYCAENGAHEVDMVINVGYIKSKDFKAVESDIRAVVAVCKRMNIILKVIIETCLLTDEEKILATNISLDAGADFVKTSTGFNSSGAVVADVKTLSSITHNRNRFFKASGGIRNGKDAYNMIKAGADRLGTSATIAAFTECMKLMENPDAQSEIASPVKSGESSLY